MSFQRYWVNFDIVNLRWQPFLKPQFEHQDRPETITVIKLVFLVLLIQFLDGRSGKDLVTSSILLQDGVVKEFFQVGTKPMPDGHTETHFFSTPDFSG